MGQNHILTAVDEYRLVLSDPEVGVDVKLTVARKCQELLAVLGRTEEAEDVRGIVETLQRDFDCHACAETTE